MLKFLLPLHALAAVVWVGGMFFAYMALRPAASELQPPERLTLWSGTLRLFFPWVWFAILVFLATGYTMIFAVFGGFATVGIHVHIMHAIGLLMMLLFLHLYFVPFRRLQKAVAAQEWPVAGKQMNQIRLIVGINLILGLITVVVASGGRYW